MSLNIQNKIEEIRNQTQQYGNTREKVANVLSEINREKIDQDDVFSKKETLNLINEVKALVASGTEFIGSINPNTSIPTGDIWAFAGEGSYSGGIVVDPGKISILTRVNDVWGEVEINIPVRSIDDIEKTSTVGLVDTYTVYFTDNTSTTFDVKNGESGAQDTASLIQTNLLYGFRTGSHINLNGTLTTNTNAGFAMNIDLPVGTKKILWRGYRRWSTAGQIVMLAGVRQDGTISNLILNTTGTNTLEDVIVELTEDFKTLMFTSWQSTATNSNLRLIAFHPQNMQLKNSIAGEWNQTLPLRASSRVLQQAFPQQSNITGRGDYIFSYFFGGSNLNAVIVKYNLLNNKHEIFDLSVFNSAFKPVQNDGHYMLSIGIAPSGKLFVGGLIHSGTPKIAKSNNPLDISSWTNTTITTATNVSYLAFFTAPDKTLYCTWRQGTSANGDTYIARYDETADTWTQNKIFEGIGLSVSLYQNSIQVDRNGVIKITGVLRAAEQMSNNYNLVYMQSSDGGTTWKKSTGENYTLPVNKDTIEVAFAIPQGEIRNSTSSCLDKSNNIHVAVTKKRTVNSVTNDWIVHVWHNGTTWQSEDILNLGTNATGTNLTGLIKPCIFMNNQGDFIIYYQKNGGVYKINTAEKIVKTFIPIYRTGGELLYDVELARDKYVFRSLLINQLDQLSDSQDEWNRLFFYETALI